MDAAVHGSRLHYDGDNMQNSSTGAMTHVFRSNMCGICAYVPREQFIFERKFGCSHHHRLNVIAENQSTLFQISGNVWSEKTCCTSRVLDIPASKYRQGLVVGFPVRLTARRKHSVVICDEITQIALTC